MTREEAINEIRSWAIPSEKGREVLETLIPELAESEDERIGNVIYCIVRDNKEVKRILEGNSVSVDNALAYLEKQKHSAKGRRGRMGGIPECVRRKAEAFRNKMEPPYDADDICTAYEAGALESTKPAEWSESDTLMCNAALELLRSHPNLMASNGINKSSVIRWLQSFRPQKQGFIDDICSKAGIAIPYLDGNQWCILKGDNIQSGVVGFGDTKEDALANFIKDVPIQQEWSEEDLQHKSWILECLADGERKMPEYAEDFRAAYKWLKSLRPSWKPSEGQMEALNALNLHGGLSYVGQQNQLISLYQDLKKLI